MAATIFDSRSGKFKSANDAQGEHSRVDEHLNRINNNPDLEDLPRTTGNWKSKEFKAVSDPFSHRIYNDVDTNDEDVMRSCIDLAIDG